MYWRSGISGIRTSTVAGCVAVAGSWLAFAGPAQAALTLELWDGVGAAVQVVDGSAGDLNATAGVVRFSGAVGGFTINVTTGFSKPVVGAVSLAQMDLRSLDISGAAGSIRIRLTDTGFNQLAVNYATLIMDGSSGGTVGYDAYVDPSNTPFGTAAPAVSAGNLGPLSGLISDFTDTLIVPPLGTDLLHPYSMTMELNIHHTSAGQQTNINATIQMTTMSSDIGVVPAPPSLALMLPGMALLLLRRRRATA